MNLVDSAALLEEAHDPEADEGHERHPDHGDPDAGLEDVADHGAPDAPMTIAARTREREPHALHI